MRSLAEFVMSGRRQAITAVVLLGLIPLVNLLNPVIVALIMMRKGLREAIVIIAWAILPLGYWFLVGDFVPLLMLIGISVMGWTLREKESWEMTLLAAIVIGAAAEGWLRLQPESLLLIFEAYESSLAIPDAQRITREQFLELMPTAFGAGYMCMAIGILMAARWMQAILYNPGGFRQEFHNLRLNQTVVLILTGLMLAATFVGSIPSTWAMYFAIPILISGLALIHAIVARRKASVMWLVMLYVILPWAVRLVVLLALIDSWYDFRTRLGRSE